MGNREASLQAAIVSWIRTLPGVFVYAVPNGHLVTKREAAMRKWTGVLPGVPDLAIVHPRGACFLECKLRGTNPAPEQVEVMDALQSLGAPCAVVRTVEEAQEALLAWGVINQLDNSSACLNLETEKAEHTAYAQGVAAVLAIASATAAKLESSPLPVLRRELAIETMTAIVEEGRVLLSSAARESD